MTIAIICSCAELGKDGVGDNSQRLAANLEELGCSCRLIALNDPYVQTPIEGRLGFPASDVPCLRLPATAPWPQRLIAARSFLAPLAPRWFSLQFAGVGWQRRGLVARWGSRFDALAGPAARHLMMHETWRGEFVGAPLKLDIVGKLQRFFTERMIRRFRPKVIHTHTPAYSCMMGELGFRAELLPLFGGLPVIAKRDDDWLFAELRKHGVALARNDRAAWWLGGFFGTLHPEWQPEPFFSTLHAAAQITSRQVYLTSAGNMQDEARWLSLARTYPHFQFVNLGRLEPGAVSHYLQALDFGIAATSWKLIPKSSTVAAMTEHGLSVIVTRDDWQWRGGPTPDPPDRHQLIRVGPDLESKLVRGLPRFPTQPFRAREVAAQLLERLSLGQVNNG